MKAESNLSIQSQKTMWATGAIGFWLWSPSGIGYGLLGLQSFRPWGCMLCTDYGFLHVGTWRRGAP